LFNKGRREFGGIGGGGDIRGSISEACCGLDIDMPNFEVMERV
jgi:hypothetical protein